MTTKKHFIVVATAIRQEYYETKDPAAREAIQNCAFRLASIYLEENPNFDRHRFMVACGIEA